MPEPLSTNGFDNLVVIDTQVVLEGKPLSQLPWQDLFQGSILLLVPRQVQTEIDKRKNDGRLGKRARAFNKLLDGFIENRVPSPITNMPKVAVATIANRSIDWVELDDLEKDDADDRIVAQMLNALVDRPEELVLMSHDMRPRDAAITHDLNAIKFPEAWLREPDPSPDEKRIATLEAQNRLLLADQPELQVRVEEVTPTPWTFVEVEPPSENDVETVFLDCLSKAPPKSSSGPYGIGANYDPSHGDRLSSWRKDLEKVLPIMNEGLGKIWAQHRFRVAVENIGSIPAENLSLEIRSGNTVLHSAPYWVLFTGKGPPYPRFHFHVPEISARDLITPRREPFSFYWDEEGPGDSLILSCASFRQEKSYSIDLSVELLRTTEPKAHIEAVVTASNLKGDFRDRLLVDVGETSKPFSEIFDVDEGKMRIEPPYDPPDDLETGDINWFRNDGSRYD